MSKLRHKSYNYPSLCILEWTKSHFSAYEYCTRLAQCATLNKTNMENNHVMREWILWVHNECDWNFKDELLGQLCWPHANNWLRCLGACVQYRLEMQSTVNLHFYDFSFTFWKPITAPTFHYRQMKHFCSVSMPFSLSENVFLFFDFLFVLRRKSIVYQRKM